MSTVLTKTITKCVILHCPGLGLASDLVGEVLQVSLEDYLFNLEDVEAEIDDKWYYSLLRDRLYNDDGDVVSWWYSPQEKLMVERDPEGHIKLYEQQVSNYLEQIARLNEEAINLMYEAMISMDSITVLQRLNNYLVLTVTGKIPC